MSKFIVLLIGVKSEAPVFYAADREAACLMAMERNKSPFSLIYIVLDTQTHERMCINDQIEFLKVAA